MSVSRGQHDPGPPDLLARRVAFGDQRLKLCAVGGAKGKADVGASHAQRMTHANANAHLVSGGEHEPVSVLTKFNQLACDITKFKKCFAGDILRSALLTKNGAAPLIILKM
jgi:hypothetical protein